MVTGKFFMTVGLLAAIGSFAAFNPAQDATQPEDLPVLQPPVAIKVSVLS
ncbi:hypothetical protein TRL7639_01432 [Falsiruegeria litorea R37]|uniref:Uncharacterized protein n=1 Tax=Falsiruegeria litorea R37 TaxID=1200284 RepID=A0A1Y5S5L1_9RHOB|nr:hypothetical protein [Falsiruegeria litorea]SLN32789.1 hypothetical protein TRL7639_01432 [Falsiruegeria litorea R37]